jgi:hypothetical protein
VLPDAKPIVIVRNPMVAARPSAMITANRQAPAAVGLHHVVGLL